MARFDDRYDDYDEDSSTPYVSMSESEQQEFLYDQLGFIDSPLDQHAHDLFWDAFYNDDLSMTDRMNTMDELADHLWEEYQIDFSLIWDWEDFREWYNEQ